MERTPRTVDNLVDTLEQHLGLLNDYIKKLEIRDKKYYKAIMGELRVLVQSANSNKPLLINLAKKFNIDLYVHQDGIKKTLGDYLNEAVFVIPKPVSFVCSDEDSLSRIDFISKAAQQDGSSHEDSSIENDLLIFKGEMIGNPFFGILIDGEYPHARQAIRIANVIYNCGMGVLKAIRTQLDGQGK